MSIKIMNLVWDCGLEKSEKFILLALADFADDEGMSIFPSETRVAWKCGYERRQVGRVIDSLIRKGILTDRGATRYNTRLYSIEVSALPARPEYTPPATDHSKGLRHPVNESATSAHESATSAHESATCVSHDPSCDPSCDPSEENKQEESCADAPAPTPKARKAEHAPIPIAVKEYRRACSLYPAKSWYEKINFLIGDLPESLERWYRTCYAWVGLGWKPTNVQGMLECYQRNEIPGGDGRPGAPPGGQFADLMNLIAQEEAANG